MMPRVDFRSWWQGEDTSQRAFVEAATGDYIWTPLHPRHHVWAMPGDIPMVGHPASVELVACIEAGNDYTGYGVVLGDDPAYRVLVYTDGTVTVGAIADDTVTLLADIGASAVVRPGRHTNRLAVVVYRKRLVVTVNGVALGPVTIRALPHGRVSLAVQLSHAVPPGSTTVRFHDLRVVAR